MAGEGPLRTLDPKLRHDLNGAFSASRCAVPTVVEGETGTGKLTLARALHACSTRTGPLQLVACDQITAENVAELINPSAENAALHLGRPDVEGTLVLKDVDALSAEAQQALLRVLDRRAHAYPRGRTPGTPIIATTCRSLARLEADLVPALFSRLSGYRARLPALRERMGDLSLVMSSMLGALAPSDTNVTFSPMAVAALARHTWPGSLRELEQCLVAALSWADAGHIDFDSLPPQIRKCLAGSAGDDSRGPPLSPDELRLRSSLIERLRLSEGNVSATARAMGIQRTQVRRWMKRFGLSNA